MKHDQLSPVAFSSRPVNSGGARLARLPWLEPVQIIVILAHLALLAAGSIFFTVEADEAWMLLSTYKAFGIPVPDTSAVAYPTVTTGGLHTLVHGLLGLLSTDIRLHRNVSLLATASLLALTLSILKRCGLDRAEAFAGCLFVLASAGLIFQSSLATAEIIATVLLLAGLWMLTRLPVLTWVNAVACGVVLGLACGTRAHCVVVFPAVFAYCLLSGQGFRQTLLTPTLIAGAGLLVVVCSFLLYLVSFGIVNIHQLMSFLSASTGVGGNAKGPSDILHDVVLGNDLVPYPALALVVLAYLFWAKRDRSDRGFRFGILLLGFGCLNLLLWLAKAPIPHVRYLYPGIPMLWLAAGIAALASLRRLTHRSSIAACHIAIVLVSATSLPASLWYFAAGESLTGAYQLIRQASFVAPREPFQAFRHQQKTAEFVRALPPDSRLLSFFPQAAYPITYLSWRPIHSVAHDWTRPGPKYLLIMPGEFTIRRFPEPSVLWLNEFASRLFESGGFVVYTVRGDAPQPKT
jgi:hypothetical protein